MMNRQIYLDDPNVGENEKKHLNRCIDSTFVSTHGPFVPEFESKFAHFLDCKKAVALQSGTAGLHMALYELGIGEGDEVILPALTFVATANAIKYVGATPVFVDVDPLTWNMDPTHVEDSISHRTKAIISVHLYGNPCAMDEIVSIARHHNLYVIEDATESLGAKYKGKFTGTFGDFGVFSFNGNKVITTGGGGMVLGSDEERVEHIRFLVNQARDEQKGYCHPEVGFNYRMTNIEAALGLAQLERLSEFIEKKKRFYEIYNQAFESINGLQLQRAYAGSESMWWLTSLVIDTQKVGLSIPEIQMKLKERGVPTRRIFTPIVEFPPYFENDKSKYAQAYNIYENGLNLPSSTLNSSKGIEFTADTLISIVNRSALCDKTAMAHRRDAKGAEGKLLSSFAA
ncbi:MAG: LegC family aminotransferase [candidate division Zixibacteria bacterium]|nr:LegC family aminotransferase [candidate division Zixibacteria bacterium]